MSQNECGNHLLMLKMTHVAPLMESTVLSNFYKGNVAGGQIIVSYTIIIILVTIRCGYERLCGQQIAS